MSGGFTFLPYGGPLRLLWLCALHGDFEVGWSEGEVVENTRQEMNEPNFPRMTVHALAFPVTSIVNTLHTSSSILALTAPLGLSL